MMKIMSSLQYHRSSERGLIQLRFKMALLVSIKHIHTQISILSMLIAIYVDGMKGRHCEGEGEGSGKGNVNTGVEAKPGVLSRCNLFNYA